MNEPSNKTKKVLLIEDDATLREFLIKRFVEQGIEVDFATDGEEGLKKMLNSKLDAVIIDVMLPKKNGFTVVDEFRKINPDSPTKIVILSNLDDMQYAANAIEKKAFAYIVKSDQSLDSLAALIEERLTSEVVSK